MCHELPREFCGVKVLCEGLCADVRPRFSAGKDEARARVRRQPLLFLDEGEYEGRERHAVLPSFLHGRCRDDERVAFNPVLADGNGFARSEHRRELKEEEELHPSGRLRHDEHDGRKFSPVDRRHRSHDGRSKDPRNSLDRVVFDVARAHGKVEDFSCAHENSFERGALSRLVETLDRVDDQGRCDLIELA